MIEHILYSFKNLSVNSVIDILIVAVLFYLVLKGLARTQALPVIQGFVIIFLATVIAGYFQLNTFRTVLNYIGGIAVLAIFILYPAAVRKLIYSISNASFFGRPLKYKEIFFTNIIEAVKRMSDSYTGALIIIEKFERLDTLIEGGTLLNAEISRDLLVSIFNKTSPLHDGAVIIRGDKMVAASCIIPHLSSAQVSDRYGTRHRAALEMSEQSDAGVIVVSEEYGEITFFIAGTAYPNLSEHELLDHLKELLEESAQEKGNAQKS